MVDPAQINFKKLNGLVPCVVQDATTGVVLMMGFMNEEAFRETLATGRVCYFSRSRNKLWLKGESSGHCLVVKEIFAKGPGERAGLKRNDVILWNIGGMTPGESENLVVKVCGTTAKLNCPAALPLTEYLSGAWSTTYGHSVNGVILSARHSYFEQVEAVVRACELEGVEAWLIADFFKTQISRTSFDDFYGRPVLVFRTTPEASWQGVLKQVLDFVGALIVLLIFLIPFAVVALIIKLTSRGPVFFRQLRAGLNGQPFIMYKFRTMVSNAEQLKIELGALNEMSGPVFKMTNDPRITGVGRWLRKFSLDEFPQLFNVLRFEMSLVGPRPLPVDEVRRFDDLAHRRRLSVKPGLTCLWQISGRDKVSDFRDWVRLDLEYIDNWSLWLDLKILWRTVPIVLAGTGAR